MPTDVTPEMVIDVIAKRNILIDDIVVSHRFHRNGTEDWLAAARQNYDWGRIGPVPTLATLLAKIQAEKPDA